MNDRVIKLLDEWCMNPGVSDWEEYGYAYMQLVDWNEFWFEFGNDWYYEDRRYAILEELREAGLVDNKYMLKGV